MCTSLERHAKHWMNFDTTSTITAKRLSLTYPPAVRLSRGIFSGHFMGRTWNYTVWRKCTLIQGILATTLLMVSSHQSITKSYYQMTSQCHVNAPPVPLTDVYVDKMKYCAVSTVGAKLMTKDAIM